MIAGLATRARYSLLCVLATVAVSVYVFVFVTPPASYLPEGEEPKTFASMSAPAGYNLSTMQRFADQIQAYFLPYVEGADPVLVAEAKEKYRSRNRTDEAPVVPPIRYLIIRVGSTRVRIIAETVDPNRLGELMRALTHEFRSYPGMRAFATRGSIISSNDGGTRSINVDLSGTDLTQLYASAEAVFLRARQVFNNPRVRATPSTRSLSQPMVEVRPQWDRAAQLQLSPDDIGFTVSAVTDGAYADEFFSGDDKIDIYFYAGRGQGGQLEDIAQTQLATPEGVVPLASIASLVETVSTATIRRINGARTVTVNIIPPDNVALETGVQKVRAELVQHLKGNGSIAPDVNVSISGASDQLAATQASLSRNYVVAVLIVYLLLVAILSHWGYPLLVMATIPLGMAGGIIGLQLLNLVGSWLPVIGAAAINQPLDMISMLGFLILMGTVVNNPILVVLRIIENRHQHAMPVPEAIADATRSRIRPIAMTTITTICGLAPLVFWGGAGTELYRGVGAIVMFGLIGSAVVSITFLPALARLVLMPKARGS
jgi:multidrug efflux pump subunit AcrB